MKKEPKKETDQEPWPRQYVLVLLIAAYTATSERGYRQEMRPSTATTYNVGWRYLLFFHFFILFYSAL